MSSTEPTGGLDWGIADDDARLLEERKAAEARRAVRPDPSLEPIYPAIKQMQSVPRRAVTRYADDFNPYRR